MNEALKVETEWVKTESYQKNYGRGFNLIVSEDRRVLGTVEPYRGTKSWWFTVDGLPPFLQSPGGFMRFYAQKEKTREKCKERILELTPKKKYYKKPPDLMKEETLNPEVESEIAL